MKILLIQPPIQDFYDTDIRLQPIGLAYLKAAAGQHHPDVEVIIRDYHHGHGRRTAPYPRELEYLKDYYATVDTSPFCGFHHFYHYGLSFEKIQEDIRQIAPDAIGISSLFSPYFREVRRIAEDIKAWTTVPILVGGSHVSAMPKEVLQVDAIDMIMRGEGERGFVEWIDYLKGERSRELVSNLGYKVDGELRLNPTADNFPIDELAFPDLSDFDPQSYRYGKKPMTFMITSRSCPHRCSFCSVHLTFGDRYRRRSVESVLAEIDLRYRQGYRIIDFEDDNLTFYKKEMKALCRALIDRYPPGELEFVAMNGISYLSLDEELLGLMKQAGFTHLNLAFVSSDQAVRESTKRPHTVEKYLQVVDLAFRLRFHIVSYQILGLPQESLDSMIQTLAFNAGQPVLLGASMFYLTPNSPIAQSFGPRNEKDVFLARLTSMAIETDHFQREDIYSLFITTRILNFIKGLRGGERDLQQILTGDLKDLTPRERLGVQLLRRLREERVLYSVHGENWVENSKFKVSIFNKVVQQAGEIVTLEGRRWSLESLMVSQTHHLGPGFVST